MMRTLRILLAAAIVSLSATPVLAVGVNASFKVTGNLGLAANAAGCTNPNRYTSICPSADTCTCYKLSKASLHVANLPLGVTIPPGRTTAFFAVDGKGTGSAGTCQPVYGDIHYAASAGPDTVEIFVFGTLCSPFSLGAPFSLSGGGAIESATIQLQFFGEIHPVGYGTANGSYLPGSLTQTFTLKITANAGL
jgi:hypothetical protein